MNINITQITNGFIIAVAGPKGQSAIYCKTYAEVLEQLKEIGSVATQREVAPPSCN